MGGQGRSEARSLAAAVRTQRPRRIDRVQAISRAWFYSASDDPLIELHLRRPREGIMLPGRVYFEPRALAGDEVDLHFQDKPPEFVAFAERVRRWIRRWRQKGEDLLLAPSLATRFDRGQIARKGIQGELELLS